MKVLASWSGGKESCLACYKAVQDGFEVSYLVNFVSEDGRCMGHGISSKLVAAQSQAVGIPIVQRRVSWETYEEGFKSVMNSLKQRAIEGAVFGDIMEIPGHEGWVDRMCQAVGLKPVKPLWGYGSEQVLDEFIGADFEAFVVAVKADAFGDEWLGRKVDRDFVKDMKNLSRTSKIDICGELGEYHTFVTDGPLFKKCLKIFGTEKTLKDGHWFLNISGFEIVGK